MVPCNEMSMKYCIPESLPLTPVSHCIGNDEFVPLRFAGASLFSLTMVVGFILIIEGATSQGTLLVAPAKLLSQTCNPSEVALVILAFLELTASNTESIPSGRSYCSIANLLA